MLAAVKSLARRLPIVRAGYAHARSAYLDYRRLRAPSEDIFVDKFRRNAWRGTESVSGTGSDLYQTRVIVRELPALLRRLGATSMLDIPCGDFHWMKTVDLGGIRYIGADVVEEIVARNRQYQTGRISFARMNLLIDALPAVDVVFCRDCLVHLSFADIERALRNIGRSGSTYLVTTTFVDRVENDDIPTGRWRPLNLERPPIGLPAPLFRLVEECTEGGGAFADKSLGVWRVSDVIP